MNHSASVAIFWLIVDLLSIFMNRLKMLTLMQNLDFFFIFYTCCFFSKIVFIFVFVLHIYL